MKVDAHRTRLGQIQQVISLTDAMMQDHLILYHAREQGDDATVAEQQRRIAESKQSLQWLLEMLVL